MPHALSFAFDTADRTGAGVRVVTALPRDGGDEQLARHEGRLKGFESRWHKTFPHVVSRAQLMSGDPGDELACEAIHAQLIVVGHPNQSHRAPLVSKWGAASLLRAAPCAVAVVPAGNNAEHVAPAPDGRQV